jgi:hypothetical protein
LTDGEFDMPGIHESLAGEGVALDSTGWDEHVGMSKAMCALSRSKCMQHTIPFHSRICLHVCW